MSILPRYPVYVISKGRWKSGLTAKFLERDGVPFKLVVEPQEADNYSQAFGAENVLILPFSNLGQGSIPARNWLWEHAKERGAERHWCIDDNIRGIVRNHSGRRIPCPGGPALAVAEDFADRYENVAIAGLNYSFFGYASGLPPFLLNCHVYSCMLVRSDLPHRWRGRYNEGSDLCLQVLADGWCTVNINAFLTKKAATMTMAGGNTDELYQGDGRLTMAKELERRWPHVVKVHRRFGRPQHRVNWQKFDTPLKLKPGIDLTDMEPNEYGLRLTAVGEVKSPRLKRLMKSAALAQTENRG